MAFDEYLAPVKRLLIPKGGVGERAVKSGIWVTLINVFDRVLQVLKLVVLARLLSPADFGLMGIALLTLAGLRRFSRLGIDSALIQREEDDVDEFLNTAWSMKAVRGVAIAGVAFVLAPYAALFFGEPRTTDIIRVIALAPIVTGLRNPGVMYLRKHLQFHRQFVYKLSGTIVDVAVAIALAFVLQNVWALVYGTLAGRAVRSLVSYLVHGYRPRPGFDRQMAVELFDYGKWILGSGIVLFLFNQGDDAFVGWLLGASALGFYQLAYRFSNAPATEVTHIISSVAFPAYAQVQSDASKLRTGYFRTLRLISLISIPMGAGIVIVAPSFVRAFLGEQWLPMVLAMQLLAFWGVIRSLGATNGPLFRAIGRPDVNTKLQAIQLALLVVLVYPATARWGIAGTALAILASVVVSNPIGFYLALGRVDAGAVDLLRILGYPLVGASTMAIAVFWVATAVPFASPLTEFFALTFAGISVYALLMIFLDRKFQYGLRGLVRNVVKHAKE